MKTVVLFGGGDGGGLIITENGVVPIPPFDPEVMSVLKATANMVTAAAASKHEAISKKLIREATTLSNLSVEIVEQVVGPLDSSKAIIFQDDDGGFTCGSTGKPPIPIPWPPTKLPTIADLVTSGIVDQDIVDLVHRAKAQKIAFSDIFTKPGDVATQVGVKLSDRSVRELKNLAPNKLDQIKDPVDREIVGFFHAVVRDGTHLDNWFTRPYEVSSDLKVSLSESALSRIIANGGLVFKGKHGLDDGDVAIAAGIAWGIVCIAIGTAFSTKGHRIDDIVTDRSGIDKI